jgi:hypothetical protein
MRLETSLGRQRPLAKASGAASAAMVAGSCSPRGGGWSSCRRSGGGLGGGACGGARVGSARAGGWGGRAGLSLVEVVRDPA